MSVLIRVVADLASPGASQASARGFDGGM